MCHTGYMELDEYLMTLPWSSPPVSAAETATRLNIPRQAVKELLHSGLADALLPEDSRPGAVRTPRGPAATESAIRELEAVPYVDLDALSEDVINVRVRAARRCDDTDRDVIGFHTDLSSAQLDLAVARWWPSPGVETRGMTFVATISGFVVAQGRIGDQTRKERGQYAYDVDWYDRSAARIWAGNRIKGVPGPVQIVHKAHD